MANYISKIKSSTGTTVYDIFAVSATTSEQANAIGSVESYSVTDEDSKTHEGLLFNNGSMQGVVELNSKGNLAVEALEKHLNLEAAKGIQVKPTTNIILDSSRRIANSAGNEVQIEAKFDDFTKNQMPEYSGKDGADESWSQLKTRARSIDLRCMTHGGIALQIAGRDHLNNENKIKFESDRTSPLGSTNVVYNGEGGKGLEFGTFNNEHASLFCGDYRFNGDAYVYGVTRETPININNKIDYPTQADDFKDVINDNKKAKWNDIIGVATAWVANGKQLGGGNSESDSTSPTISSEYIEQIESNTTIANNAMSIAEQTNKQTQELQNYVYRKDKNGNLEITASGLGKYAVENDPTSEIHPVAGVPAILYTYEEYCLINPGMTEEEFEALPENDKIKTPAIEEVLPSPASLDLVSDGKVAVKSDVLELKNTTVEIPVEITKTGKLTVGNYPETAKGELKTYDEYINAIKKVTIGFGVSNESTISKLLTDGGVATNEDAEKIHALSDIKVSLYDVIKLVEKVSELEDRIATLENNNA